MKHLTGRHRGPRDPRPPRPQKRNPDVPLGSQPNPAWDRMLRLRAQTPDPSWSTDNDGYVVEPLSNRGTLDDRLG